MDFEVQQANTIHPLNKMVISINNPNRLVLFENDSRFLCASPTSDTIKKKRLFELTHNEHSEVFAQLSINNLANRQTALLIGSDSKVKANFLPQPHRRSSSSGLRSTKRESV